jgi:ligand-binding sensor domain-containing protein
MILLKKNSFLLFLLLVLNTVIGQSIPSKNITINDGLPSNSIKCIFKDSRGLMWIGTDAGLCCFDGSSYKVYNETNGLKYSEVWSIAEDKDKNIWLSLYGNGLAKFDGKKFTYYDKNDGLINNGIRKIHYSKKHNCLVLATENGLSLFDGKHFKSFVQKKSIGRFQVVGINETLKKIQITVSFGDVYNLEIASDIKKSKLVKQFKPIPSYSSFVCGDNYMSGGTSHNLFVKNLTTNLESTYECPIIWDFAKDLQNNIYCASWNVTDPKGGLFKYSNKQLTDITQRANIKSTGLWCLYYDKETKQLWVGSIDKGIYIVDLSQQKKVFEPSFFGLKQIEIQCLFNDSNDNKWIGARDNIIILHKNLSFTIFDNKLLWKKIDAYLKQSELSPYSIDSYNIFKNREGFTCSNIVSDNQGFIWVTTTFGIFCFDENYKIRYFNFTDGGGHIIFDEKDQLLYGAMYSNMYLNPNKFDRLKSKQLSIEDKNIPLDINKILRNGNQVWFGTSSNGLFNYHNNTFYSLNLHKQFSEKHIKDIIINDKGELVIGTNSGLVYICKWTNNKLQILHLYKPRVELYGTSISFIEQSNEYYFIGTNKGINILKDHKFIKLINQSEGIKDVQFNDCIKDKNGDLWIATNDGLLFLNVKEFLKKESRQNSIQITNIKVNGINYNSTNLLWDSYSNSELKLDYNQNDIEISYNNYNLLNADKNVYRCKIVGLTNSWSDFDNSKKIKLRRIQNGRYQVLIAGKNIGTGVIFQTRTLSIIITPPYWKTNWFIILCIIAVLIIGFISYKKRIQYIAKQERAKSEIQKRLAETKMEALQSQMNPHFIFNAMNSIQNFIIQNNVDEALMYMAQFSKLIRQTLDNSSQPRISLEKEIHYLKTYIRLENMRFKEAVNFKLILPKEIDTYEIEIPPMLLQPFIENVFVHAFDSHSINPTLELTFLLRDSLLICEIKDNGKGISEQNLNKLNVSKGIKLVKERIGLFQHTNSEPVTIISFPNQGTTIILNIELDV